MFFLSRLKSWMTSRHRDIFVYWDGAGWRRADPIKVGTSLEKECPNYLELLGAVVEDVSKHPVGEFRDKAIKVKGESARALAQAAFTVFGLKPLTDHEGLTEGEALGVLTQFFVFMERVAAEAKLFTA